jgi:hypothetical protein
MLFFDWQGRWQEVEEALTMPMVKDSFELTMRCICKNLDTVWDPSKAPIEYGRKPLETYSDHPMNRLRCIGQCYAINTFAGVVGLAIEPRLEWQMVCTVGPTPVRHCVAIGSYKISAGASNDVKNIPRLMMDLNIAPDSAINRRAQYRYAFEIWNAMQMGTAISMCALGNCLTNMREYLAQQATCALPRTGGDIQLRL